MPDIYAKTACTSLYLWNIRSINPVSYNYAGLYALIIVNLAE